MKIKTREELLKELDRKQLITELMWIGGAIVSLISLFEPFYGMPNLIVFIGVVSMIFGYSISVMGQHIEDYHLEEWIESKGVKIDRSKKKDNVCKG